MKGYGLHREPKIENKYNLTIKDVRNLKIKDRTGLQEPLFWRNNAIDAWCCSGNTAKNYKDREFGTYNEYWIGIYDEDAKAYKGKLRVDFSSYGGMCGYNFEKFYQSKDIEHKIDLEIQEKFLEKINQLIDEGVLGL